MRRIVLIGMAALFALSFMSGCSDDECASCPEPFVQTAVVVGQVRINSPDLNAFIYFFSNDGGTMEIDSVLIRGEQMVVESGTEGFIYYAASYEGAANGLVSGDSITIQIFIPGGTSTCRLLLLDQDLDQPTGFNHPESSPYDTVAVGEQIVLTWDAVTRADWYGVTVYYSYDSNGTHNTWSDIHIQTGTTFTVPATTTSFNGYISLGITATAGPNPETSSGNITGGTLRGAITSSAYEGVRVYIGTGNAYPSSVQPVPPQEAPSYFEFQTIQFR